MDARRGYPEEQDRRPTVDEHGYAEPQWRPSGHERHPDDRRADRYGDPQAQWVGEGGQRPAGPMPVVVARGGYSVARGGDGGPPWAEPGQAGFRESTAEAAQLRTEPIDRTARPATGAPAGDGVYRIRRRTMTAMFTLLTVLFELPALHVLLDAAVGGPVSAVRVISGTFLVLGLPIFAYGLGGLVPGDAAQPGPDRAWSRPPIVYLIVGIALFFAAAIAVT